MFFITAQQAKFDLELVPKEKRLEIGKCNRRLNPRKIQREPTFQVFFDALALTPCYSAFVITADVLKLYMHQFWDAIYKHDTFYRFKMDKRKRFKLNLEIFRDIFKICPREHGQDFDALPTDEEIMSFLKELRHTGEINSLNDVVVDHMHQPWRTFATLINKSLSGKTTEKTLSWRIKIRMHTSRDDYLISTLRFVSIKEETQIYGDILPESLTSSEMKETKAYKTYLEPIEKSKRVKRHTKKSTAAPTRGVVIGETPEMPLTKKKEKSMRDFHKTHPNGSGIVTKTAPSVAKIKPSVTSEGTGVKPGVPDVAEEETSKNDEEEVKDEYVKTPSNDSDEDETKITDTAKGNEDEEMEYTTSQLYDDADIRLNEPVDTDKVFVQEEGTDATMTNVQQGNKNIEILQVIKDVHMTLSTVSQKTKVPVTSSSHSSDLAAKFLNFLDIPHTDAEIV
nr:hypothetical protein [Tanacetum cinerariifolium]